MAKAVGMGGVFFRARDPKALAAWYQTHLGINTAPTDMEAKPWIGSEGVTVFAPFKADTEYFPADKAFMLNFRVDDLTALTAQLREAGIEVSHEMAEPALGKFARIHDPEGNPVELWEPAAG